MPSLLNTAVADATADMGVHEEVEHFIVGPWHQFAGVRNAKPGFRQSIGGIGQPGQPKHRHDPEVALAGLRHRNSILFDCVFDLVMVTNRQVVHQSAAHERHQAWLIQIAMINCQCFQ